MYEPVTLTDVDCMLTFAMFCQLTFHGQTTKVAKLIVIIENTWVFPKIAVPLFLETPTWKIITFDSTDTYDTFANSWIC